MWEPNAAALQNPEVQRLLHYMACFASPGAKVKVSKLMDKLTHSPGLGSVVSAKHSAPGDPENETSVPYPTAQMAAEAVRYAEGGPKPEWLGKNKIGTEV